MNKIQRISILGTGLLGASLGLVLRQRRDESGETYPIITGYDRPDTVVQAKYLGCVDEIASSPEEAVASADIVFLATPLGYIIDFLEKLAPHFKKGAIITDVGSVKLPVERAALRFLPDHLSFVGGHPMAGSEKSGPENADAFLFENVTWVLCPSASVLDQDIRDVAPGLPEVIEATGARIMVLGSERHDRIAAAISHIPQLLAVSLMRFAAKNNANDEAFLQLAAGGFRDMTRIASSSFSMWKDILEFNREAISAEAAGLIDVLTETLSLIADHKPDLVERFFDEAKTARNAIPRHSKGFLLPLSDVYVYAQDKPGFLLDLTRTIYDATLNIKDIELLKIREGTGGAFRVGFPDDTNASLAIEALTAAGYTAYRL